MNARLVLSVTLVGLGLLGCGQFPVESKGELNRDVAQRAHHTAKAMIDVRVRAFLGGGGTRAQGLNGAQTLDRVLFAPSISAASLRAVTASAVPCYTIQGDSADADSDFIMNDAAITYNNCKTTSSDGRTVIFSGILRQHDGSDADYTSGFAFNRESFTASYLSDGYTETVTLDQRANVIKTQSGQYTLAYTEGQNSASTDITFGGQLISDAPHTPFASGLVNVTGGVSVGSTARVNLSLETKDLHADTNQLTGVLNGGSILLRDGQNTMSTTYNPDGSSIDLYNGAPY